jgi:hypothetical protein
MTCESPRLATTSSPFVRFIKHTATVDPDIAGSVDSYLKLSNRRASSSASAPLRAAVYSPFLNSGRRASRLCRFSVAWSETRLEPLYASQMIPSLESPRRDVLSIEYRKICKLFLRFCRKLTRSNQYMAVFLVFSTSYNLR